MVSELHNSVWVAFFIDSQHQCRLLIYNNTSIWIEEPLHIWVAVVLLIDSQHDVNNPSNTP